MRLCYASLTWQARNCHHSFRGHRQSKPILPKPILVDVAGLVGLQVGWRNRFVSSGRHLDQLHLMDVS